jgi:hypothetical protein
MSAERWLPADPELDDPGELAPPCADPEIPVPRCEPLTLAEFEEVIPAPPDCA